MMTLNNLDLSPCTTTLSQYEPSLWLARYVEHRREELAMSVEFAARLAGMADSEWAALESGWVPEDEINQWAVAQVLEVSHAQISLLAAISRYNQSLQK
jgi:hypothetical protein